MDDRKEAGVSCVNHALNGVVPGWVVFGLLIKVEVELFTPERDISS